MSDPIKTGTKPDGKTYYWFRISAGNDPATGKRVQVYKSFDTKREAKAKYGKILNDLAEHRFVARSAHTVNAYLDKWEPAHERDLEEGSRTVIRHDLQPVRTRLGERSYRTSHGMTLTPWLTGC